MANAAALINEELWRRDKEFQKVPRLAQCTFCQILSQKDLDTAGVLTLHLDLLAKACEELTVEQLRADFTILEASRFLLVDYDTDEVFVRSYVRRVSAKNRNSWLSVPKNARMVGSKKIRHELALELRRLRRKDADELADEIDPVPTPSGPRPDPVSTRSECGTPSRPRPDGDSSVLVSVLESPTAGSNSGRGPRPECRKHEQNSEDNCRDCMRRRKWDDENAEYVAADELEQKRAARAAALKAQLECPHCDEEGWVVGDDGKPVEPAVKCSVHKAC